MIIYIHGFGSSGQANKARAFRKYFKSIGEDYIAPSLPYNPQLAIETLDELINSYKEEVSLIGSSLGGFYATYLAQNSFVKKVILINPATNPLKTLHKVLGDAPNFYDESSFQWTEKHLHLIEKYTVKDISKFNHKIMLLTQTGDEVLDYQEGVEKYKQCKQIVEEGGNHHFENIEKHFETIREFCRIGNHNGSNKDI